MATGTQNQNVRTRTKQHKEAKIIAIGYNVNTPSTPITRNRNK